MLDEAGLVKRQASRIPTGSCTGMAADHLKRTGLTRFDRSTKSDDLEAAFAREALPSPARHAHARPPIEEVCSMDRRLFLVTAAALAALGGGAAAQSAKAVLTNAKGAEIGTVELTEGTDGVLVTLKARHLPAGEHAFHIHAVGKCEPPFTSAGSHFNPGGKKHGMMAAEGQHAGDMPNLVVPKSGVLTVEFVNTQVTLKKGVPNSL